VPITSVTVYSHGAVFSDLYHEWLALLKASRANTVFCTPQWQASWWQAFGGDHQLHVLAFRDGQELVGLAPLMRGVEDHRRCLCFIGSLDVTDYFDLLIKEGYESAVFAAFLDHLMNMNDWDVLDLHSIRDCSPTLTMLPPLGRERGYKVLVEKEDVCPVIDLPPTWEEYLANLDKKDRHELRRKLRRLQREAHWSWQRIQSQEELAQALQDFFTLHAKSGQDKADFWEDTLSRRTFFEANATAMHQAGWLHLSFLEISGRRAAAIYAYDYGDTTSLYNSGYDPAYGYLSVGLLLVALTIQDAIQAGKKRFDFLRGSEPYKYSFGAKDTAVYHLAIYKA